VGREPFFGMSELVDRILASRRSGQVATESPSQPDDNRGSRASYTPGASA